MSPGGGGLLTQRSWRAFRIRGRLRAHVTVARAQAELDAIMHELEREHPDTNKDNVMILRSEIDRRFAQSATIPILLLILVALIILITCANIAEPDDGQGDLAVERNFDSGVGRNSVYGEIANPAEPIFYLPVSQSPSPQLTLHLRSSRFAYGVATAVRTKARTIDPELAPISILTMQQVVNENGLFVPRVLTVLSGGLATIALLLAVVGLYGVVSFMVSRRTQEIGIRMALGARRGTVLAMIMRNGLSTVAVGLLVGLGGAMVLTPFVSSLLVGVSPRDPVAFGGIAIALMAASGVHSGLPPFV